MRASNSVNELSILCNLINGFYSEYYRSEETVIERERQNISALFIYHIYLKK